MKLENEQWTEPEKFGKPGEVMWQYGMQNGTYFAGSYSGEHYTIDFGGIDQHFNYSTDGIEWKPVNPDRPVTYNGGISEIGWSFDLDGNLWGVGRNEDGDDSRWGSRIFKADADDISKWDWTESLSDPTIYESPRMFRHGDKLYLIARTDPDGTFYNPRPDVSTEMHHLLDLGAYSTRRHGTALWELNMETGKLERLLELPGCGDTAFPSIVRIGKHKYLIANYTSPVPRCEEWSWFEGQVSPLGTGLYYLTLEFEEK